MQSARLFFAVVSSSLLIIATPSPGIWPDRETRDGGNTPQRAERPIAGVSSVSTLAAAFSPAPQVGGGPYGRDEVDISLFYEELAPYGEWFYKPPHGWVWTPYDVGPDWRPYQSGRWVWTEYGWTWASDEPFGWAVYHYGRWYPDPYYGWTWVPDGTWSPAWVAWRRGDGWMGWAPLPPEEGVRVGVQVGGLNINVSAVRKHAWNFVEERHFCEPDVRPFVVRPSRNVTIVNNTQNVTNYNVVNNTVVNNSVNVQTIEKRIGRSVPRYRIREADRPSANVRADARNAILSIFRPKVARGPAKRTPDAIFPARRDTDKRSHEFRDRHNQELQELEGRAARERAAFEDRTKREKLRVGKLRISPDELNKRHARERQALEDQLKRERKLLERQHEREDKGETGKTKSTHRRFRFGGRDDKKKD